jgi:pyruvate dehydrogenase E2 component (dihydrolipoamide acetyltransferase)
MARDVIMPALGMAQEAGTLIRWLKAPGEAIIQGEPLMEIETDKATVEIEAPASGTLAQVTAQPGDVIPVGQRIALISTSGETGPVVFATPAFAPPALESAPTAAASAAPPPSSAITASPLAARVATEHGVDLAEIKPAGGRVNKEDVLAFLEARKRRPVGGSGRASPKARRLAQERGLDLKAIRGSGPDGAVLATDVIAAKTAAAAAALAPAAPAAESLAMSRIWRVMAERVTQAWTTIPHFHLQREVNAAGLAGWRAGAEQRTGEKISYTDLLLKLVAAALGEHPRLNAAWQGGASGSVLLNADINLGLAVAVEDGLVVPVIHHADELGLGQLAARRRELVFHAQAGHLSLDDLSGGTFTISNLGMYGVDAFNAIINPPQVAILAVGRLADRVVAVQGQPVVQPMITLNLACDHRVVDGARGAQFMLTLAELIEDPLRLLD